MIWKAFSIAALVALAGSPALSELRKVDKQSEFVRIISGKTLSRPFIKLQVTSNGQITGKGAGYAVTGDWQWQNGYFCRNLFWGGDALGYNCQEVRAQDGRIRFTSDKGKGDSAEFSLR